MTCFGDILAYNFIKVVVLVRDTEIIRITTFSRKFGGGCVGAEIDDVFPGSIGGIRPRKRLLLKVAVLLITFASL